MTTTEAALREALAPFAKCVEWINDDEPDDEWAKFRLLIGDYRRAAAALSQPPASSTVGEEVEEPTDEAQIVVQWSADAYGACTGSHEDAVAAAARVIQEYGDRRASAAALSKPTPVEAKPWYETDAHRDLSRIIPDMEGKIAEAKTRYAHCLPDHLFAPLEASITELRVLRHEVAAQPTPVEAGLREAEALRIAWWNDMRERGVSQDVAIEKIRAALSKTPPPPSREG